MGGPENLLCIKNELIIWVDFLHSDSDVIRSLSLSIFDFKCWGPLQLYLLSPGQQNYKS